jgi:hypothetical protein
VSIIDHLMALRTLILKSLPLSCVCPNVYCCVLKLPTLPANLFSFLHFISGSVVQQNVNRTDSNNGFPVTGKNVPNHIFRCPLRANLSVLPTATPAHKYDYLCTQQLIEV